MNDETEVKTMVVKKRRSEDVKIVTQQLRADDRVDSALPKVQQDKIRRRCGLKEEKCNDDT